MRRREVLFAVIGGVVGGVLVMAADSFSPLGAHNEAVDLDLGYITCRGLTVVDSENNHRVKIGAFVSKGFVFVKGKDDARVFITAGEEIGEVQMRSNNFNGHVEITARDDGAGVFVVHEDNQVRASITAREDGGEARVSDNGNIMRLTLAGLRDEY